MHHHLLPHLAGKRHVIWDWNGTLLDDVDLCVELIGELLAEQGLKQVSRDEYLDVFAFPVKSYYENVGFDFERESFDSLAMKFMGRYQERVGEAKLHNGVSETLTVMRMGGVACSVLSATQEDFLVDVLTRNGLIHHFDHVFGIGDHYARSKLDSGRALIEKLAMPKEELVLIGDTDHDLEVAEALGIDAVLLEGGHQSAQRLRTKHRVVVART